VGNPSHKLTEEKAVLAIHTILKDIGQVDYFKCDNPTEGSNKMHATASFTTREAALEAVAKLNDSDQKLLKDVKFSIKRQISIKYNIPVDLADAVREELDSLS